MDPKELHEVLLRTWSAASPDEFKPYPRTVPTAARDGVTMFTRPADVWDLSSPPVRTQVPGLRYEFRDADGKQVHGFARLRHGEPGAKSATMAAAAREIDLDGVEWLVDAPAARPGM